MSEYSDYSEEDYSVSTGSGSYGSDSSSGARSSDDSAIERQKAERRKISTDSKVVSKPRRHKNTADKTGATKVKGSDVALATVEGKRHLLHNDAYGTGKRKALLVGINYIGQGKAELGGCVNDVSIAKHRLERYHFSEFLVLLEGTAMTPTKANIRKGFEWLIAGAAPGDVLWLHFSGHGTQVKDRSGDETDGLDESICPVDFRKAGVILDDEIRSDIIDKLPAGCTLYCVFDCCHSGTMADLAHVYDSATRKFVFDNKRKHTKAEVFAISGCLSTQKSADLPPGAVNDTSGAQGALTGALYNGALKSRISWADAIALMRHNMEWSKLTQVPQLEAGKPHDAGDVAFRRIYKVENQDKPPKAPPAQPPVHKGTGVPPGTCAMAAFAVIGLCFAFSAAAMAAAENNGVSTSRLESLIGFLADDGGPPLEPEDAGARVEEGTATAQDEVV